jgi:hypothetical protein
MTDTKYDLLSIINMYPFIKTEKDRSDSEFIKLRIEEYQLIQKQRKAVAFCKSALGFKTTNLSQIGNEEKEMMEKCLTDNFLSEDPNYFGKRDVIFLDLHNI